MKPENLYLCSPKKTTPFLAKKFKILLNNYRNRLINSILEKVVGE